ncbi:MAG: ATP-dependent helicase [Treponema sp.]|jgi:DNA helicase-2/ATP-dependent DNA helicase PcrA|nr:ATP-dependent helicase [Treponema sp.]
MSEYPPYLEILNPEQRRAVLHTGNPLLILAGAGSGKTRVLTAKIAWLIRERGVDPRSILAVTFTNKAAREMADRARQIDGRAGDAMLRTFHSFGAWFLRRNGRLAGLDSGFIIYNDDDVVSLLSSNVMENVPKAEVREIAYHISRAKDYFLSPDDPGLVKIDSRKKFRDIYTRYEQRMAAIGNVDFGDLIKKPVEILRSQPEVARRFRERFRVIMVDEYQDANVAQFRLLKELCGPETYVCVVGDDDQSIYRFRGAEVKNILEFSGRFSGTEIIKLERNYRSTAPILKAASSVVNHNRGRLGKTLVAERGDGTPPVLKYLPNQDKEADFCANLIEESVRNKKASWSDWAVLYRTNAQSMGFENEFLRRGIPYTVVGSLKFYEREEIKDALALLSLLVNPRDEVAFRRVVNKPARSVGSVTVDKIIENAEINGGDLLETSRTMAHTESFSPKALSGINEFLKVIDNGKSLIDNDASDSKSTDSKTGKKKRSSKKHEELVSGEGLSVCVVRLIKDSGIADYHRTRDEDMGKIRLTNLQELVNSASLYPQSREGLLKFLELIELDRSLIDSSLQSNLSQSNSLQSNGDKNTVTLITFHNTKGLEFKRVIMTGIEQGVFPREDIKGDELEEERRLFYVGATRAMDELYFTSCSERRMYGRTLPLKPSPFLREIDKDCLQIKSVSSHNSGFSPNRYISAAKSSEIDNISGWRRGERLFHDDHGYGAVMEVRNSEDGPVVRVRFDTGKEMRFLSEHQSRAIVKIKEDY